MAAPGDRSFSRSSEGEIELAAPSARGRVIESMDELELDLGLAHVEPPPRRVVPPPPEPTPTRRNAIVEIALPERVPDACGTLGETPLAHVLVSLATRALSGSVVLTVGDDVHALVFREGILERVASPIAPLGEILATLGALEEDEVEFAVHRAREEGTALGAQLVLDGLAQEETIATAVAAQTDERLVALAGLSLDTPYEFFAGDDVLEGHPVDAHAVDPIAAVMACVRGMNDEAPMDKVLHQLGERRLALHSAADLGRFGLVKEETKAAEILQWSWRPYAELVETLDDGHAALKRVAYALAITKHFDFGETSWPLGVVRPPPRAPKAPRFALSEAPEPPPPVARDARTVAPPRDAPSVPPPSARPIESLATSPDPPPARPPATSQPTLTTPSHVRDRAPSQPPSATPASGMRATDYGPLTPRPPIPSQPPPAREAAIEFIPLPPVSRPPAPSRPPSSPGYDASAIAAMSADERTIEASAALARAEVLLSRNDNAGAERLAAQAVELDRGNAEALAVLGWLRAMKPGPTALTDALRLLDESIKRNPSSDRALFYRGSLLKRASRENDAIRDFRRAVDLNPKNIDAAREVRLHTIRNGGSEKAGTKRLIGKLFGK